MIRTSPDPKTAREQLMARDWPAEDVAALITLIDDPRHRINADGTARLSRSRRKAILDLRLQRLTALGRDEIADELDKLARRDRRLSRHPASRARVQAIVKDELADVKTEFATPRRTEIVEQDGEVEDEDLIQREDMVVTVTHAGYIKRVPLSTYRAQRRGGKGRSGMPTRDEDFVTRLFVANTHTPVLFFSSRGKVYKEKVWRLPIGGAAGARQGADQHPAAGAGRAHHHHHAAAGGRGDLGQARRDVRHHRRHRAPQQAVRLRRGQPQRQDRHEARRGRGDRRRADLHRARRRAARPPPAASASASPSPTCACSPGRNSIGVRGIALAEGDRVISLAILRHVEADADERAAYLKHAPRGAPARPAPRRRADARGRGGVRARSALARSAMPRCRRTSSSC